MEVNPLTFLSSQALVRKIDTSDNIYIMESTTGNLFSLTQEGAPLCRIIAKVNFRVGDQTAGLVGRRRKICLFGRWEQLAQICLGHSTNLLCDFGRVTFLRVS